MKNTLLIFITILLAAPSFAQSRKDYDRAATKFQNFYNKNQPDSLYKLFSERVKTNMTLNNTKAMFTNMHAQQGVMRSHAFIKQDDRFTFYRLVYDKEKWVLVIALNKQKTFQSFRLMPDSGDESKLK